METGWWSLVPLNLKSSLPCPSAADTLPSLEARFVQMSGCLFKSWFESTRLKYFGDLWPLTPSKSIFSLTGRVYGQCEMYNMKYRSWSNVRSHTNHTAFFRAWKGESSYLTSAVITIFHQLSIQLFAHNELNIFAVNRWSSTMFISLIPLSPSPKKHDLQRVRQI